MPLELRRPNSGDEQSEREGGEDARYGGVHLGVVCLYYWGLYNRMLINKCCDQKMGMG